MSNCGDPPEHPNATVTLKGKGAARFPLGAKVTYVCPCGYWWNRTNSSGIQSECKGSLGWTIHKDELPTLNCIPIPTTLMCPNPQNGSSVELVGADTFYAECYFPSSIPPPPPRFPGVTLRYRCTSPMYRFSNGTKEVEILCDNKKWIPAIELNCFGPTLKLVQLKEKVPLWEAERICQVNANGSLAIPSSKEELIRIKTFLIQQNLAGNDVGLGGHIPNVTNSEAQTMPEDAVKRLWEGIVGVPIDGWCHISVLKDGSIYQHCLFAYEINNGNGIGLDYVECGRPLAAFLCYENEPILDCPQPQEPPDSYVELETYGKTNFSLGDNATYVRPCWKTWNSSSNPEAPFRTSQCFGSLGWKYKLEDLRTRSEATNYDQCGTPSGRLGNMIQFFHADPDEFCPPLILPRDGDPYTRAVKAPTCTTPNGTYPPGNFSYECGLENFYFSTGDTRLTWTCRDDGEWAPGNVSVACSPLPAITCESPGDENAIAFPDYYLVGSTVYCIHNESFQLPLYCGEDLTWYPMGFTPCMEVYPYFEVENKRFVLGKPREGSFEGNFAAEEYCHEHFNGAGLPELRKRNESDILAASIRRFVNEDFAPLPYSILKHWKEGTLPEEGPYDPENFWEFRDGQPIPHDLFVPAHPNDPENLHCSALRIFDDVGFRDVNCSRQFHWALCHLDVDDSMRFLYSDAPREIVKSGVSSNAC
ncbi:unnamed protein product [Darwinula stevensoni]|uniref:Sushi domain-containing protein n=1 Tax=Darwinula stevensoni TaxID=69355 RepID=A0A7R8X472_9CRUS|nr:unnamed protein product [Darwinula stevensoni]CAG0883146.1 unnamed protein product [Darwinula stevensoni]